MAPQDEEYVDPIVWTYSDFQLRGEINNCTLHLFHDDIMHENFILN